MTKEIRTIEIEDMEIRTSEDGKTIVGGYAAVFEKLSVPLYGFREKIRFGAFAKSLKNVKALWNHNADIVLGSTNGNTLKLKEDRKGLKFEIFLPETTWGKDAAESIKRGDVDGVSFGFTVNKDEWDQSDEKNVIRTLVDVNLIEISPTPFPAYPQTSVGVRSAEEVYQDFLAQKSEETNNIEMQKQEIRQKLELEKQKIKFLGGM